jgi:hypothetical protein
VGLKISDEVVTLAIHGIWNSVAIFIDDFARVQSDLGSPSGGAAEEKVWSKAQDIT